MVDEDDAAFVKSGDGVPALDDDVTLSDKAAAFPGGDEKDMREDYSGESDDGVDSGRLDVPHVPPTGKARRQADVRSKTEKKEVHQKGRK